MGGGGVLGQVTEIATGGLVKSKDTKQKIQQAKDAQYTQAMEIKKQKDKLAMEEEERKKRVLRSRQGRRGLLYQSGDELGVQRSSTLGG